VPNKERTVEEIRAERDAMAEQIEALESEVAALSATQVPVDWDTVNEPETITKMLEAEQRRIVAPAQLRAGRIRERELRLEELQLLIAEVEGEIAPAYEALEEAKEARIEAKEAEDKAYGYWQGKLDKKRDLESESSRIVERDLHLLRNEAQRGTEHAASPVVRSLWQNRFSPNTTDPGPGGNPGGTRVAPASVGEGGTADERQPVGVIPQEALKQAKKAAK
jgi:hypothetical protein